MLNTLLGTKGKMTQTYIEGTRVSVTKLSVGPCVVTQIKTDDHDGYMSVQLGYGLRKLKNTSKALQGHINKIQNSKFKTQKETVRYFREVRIEKESDLKVGDEITLSDVFKRGDQITITGVSKGKGFAGVVKRWHFAGGPKTHGQSDRHRAPGSIGQGTTPGRVYKGKHMAGRMGSDTVTIKNLIVVDIDKEKNELLLSGPVPGSTGGLLTLVKTGSGKLEELVEEVPEAQVEQVEVDEETKNDGEKEEAKEQPTETKEEIKE
ncbi:MAG: 50S ribosomal protein L3 [Microgenomates group bacterium GW2011_GWC1_37_12b]|uniref:Large ribosomal subunit protein uL3 n=1 Tax=Candidatus Woesebacteria bacterium GW2011_GWB1_38_8b TaxID=1618571 RepID=A0A0G0L9P6_9BACT|nr:MAG: 50S ribosomal protein L3 [Microgenomates group bacterium GW2011_GWC1_37_12b]KKQ87717.1 MAG: 50S ribosomal protein L3 [Candidatus Woesebacteria bacterium GW2011_GWB1_38_8b]